MGKQRQKKNGGQPRSTAVNSIDWEERARELVRMGISSFLILDNRGHNDRTDRRTLATPPQQGESK